MQQFEKDRLNQQTQRRYLWLRFCNGCKSLRRSLLRPLLLFAYAIPVTGVWLANRERMHLYLENIPYISPAFIFVCRFILFPAVLAGGILLLLILFGTPWNTGRFQNAFYRIGLTNSADETPVLLSKERDKKRENVCIYTFDGVGIPLCEWENKQQRLEAALDLHIVQLKEGKSKRFIQLCAVPASGALGQKIEWRDKYLVADGSTLVLGRSPLGIVTVDLAKIPHILLGGSTGSGKSVLLKTLLMQALKKHMNVSIADFKGGVDFPPVWHERCRMCFDKDALLLLLDELLGELEHRKALFRKVGCANLEDYNRQTGSDLPRYILACDEAAEILDKTGLTKEQRETVSRLENKLAVIARQGRAFGIHLILATQRPDANILPGQIRNNIDCRICGRADTILSQIILDSTAAAEQIPKDAAGRFLLHDGTVFQAFWWSDAALR